MKAKIKFLASYQQSLKNQYPNNLNQSSSSLISKNLNENSHNIKQLTSQEPRDPPIARPCSPQLQQISHPTKRTTKEPSTISQ